MDFSDSNTTTNTSSLSTTTTTTYTSESDDDSSQHSNNSSIFIELSDEDIQKRICPLEYKKLTLLPASDAIGFRVVNVMRNNEIISRIKALLLVQIPANARVVGEHGGKSFKWHVDGFTDGNKYVSDVLFVNAATFMGDDAMQIAELVEAFLEKPSSLKLVSFHDHQTEWQVGKYTRLGASNKALGTCTYGLHFVPRAQDTSTYWGFRNGKAMMYPDFIYEKHLPEIETC